jgi:hypothetical protein
MLPRVWQSCRRRCLRPRQGRGVGEGQARGQKPCPPGAQHGANTFQNIMEQRVQCCHGEASHAVVVIRAQGGPATALHCGGLGVQGQHCEAEAVSANLYRDGLYRFYRQVAYLQYILHKERYLRYILAIFLTTETV